MSDDEEGDYNFGRYEEEDDLILNEDERFMEVIEEEEIAAPPLGGAAAAEVPMNRLVPMIPQEDPYLKEARTRQYEAIDDASYLNSIALMGLLYAEKTQGLTFDLLEDCMKNPENYKVHF